MSDDSNSAPSGSPAEPPPPPAGPAPSAPAYPPAPEPAAARPAPPSSPPIHPVAGPSASDAPPLSPASPAASDPVLPGPSPESVLPPERLLPPTPLSQAEPLMAAPPVAGPVPDASLIPVAPPERASAAPVESVPASGGYRALTAGIVAFLVLLLAGAIALIVYLSANTTLPSFGAGGDPDPEPLQTTVTQSEPPEQTPQSEPSAAAGGTEPLAQEPCGALCMELAGEVGATVIGADGGAVWEVSRGWGTAETATTPAAEVAGAAYESEYGALDVTVWAFDDAAQALVAFDEIGADLGTPFATDAVTEDERGIRHTFRDGGLQTILWTMSSHDGEPWVMEVQGIDHESLFQFYLALPF